MKILEIRPEPPGFGNAKTIARFDLELSEDCRLYNIGLRQMPDGAHRICAPNAFGKHSATFAPALAQRITAAATAALGGSIADDRSTAVRV